MAPSRNRLILIAIFGLFFSESFAQVGLTSSSSTVFAGYAAIAYEAATNDEFKNDFTASFSPVFLYSVSDNFLFESELEFGLSGEQTTTSLEYAQIDYLGFESWQIIAGKFLVPFGLFGERTHPSWINKLPTAPLLYGHAHGGVAEGGTLLPILSDAGVMTRYKKVLSDSWSFDFTGWISQGPRAGESGEDEHDEDPDDHEETAQATAAKFFSSSSVRDGDDEHADEAAPIIPGVGYGVAFSDNNSNKMIGARLGLVSGPKFEAFVSGFHARYDDEGELDVVASNLAIEYRTGPWDFKSEGLLMWQDVLHGEEIEVLTRSGFYLQMSRRKGKFEPVLRWSNVPESTFDGQIAFQERSEISFGINYWLQPSIPLKLSYHADMNTEDHIYLQWAFGF